MKHTISDIVDFTYNRATNTLEVSTSSDSGEVPVPVTPPPTPPPEVITPPPVATPTNVVRAYDIDLINSTSTTTRMNIPAGKGILSSKFTTGNNPEFQASLFLQPPAGMPFSTINFWVSTEPGGPQIDAPGSAGQMGIEGGWKFFLKQRSGCVLQLNTTYYFNMQHVEAGSPTSIIDRKQSSFGLYG